MGYVWFSPIGYSIQRVACTVFSQPVSACVAERIRSIYGHIKGPARNRMQHVVADKRVYVHEALHYQTKLQNASYRAQVEAWSDSESSESDDEQRDMTTFLVM